MRQPPEPRSVAKKHALSLFSVLTGEQPRIWRDLDAPGAQLPPGKRPDFIGEDTCGREYVFEVTRLLTPELRRLENFAKHSIANHLEGRLPGRYFFWLSLDGMPKDGIPSADVNRILNNVQVRLEQGTLGDRFEPVPGYRIERFNGAGHSLIPLVLAQDLPYDLTFNDPLAIALQRQFESTVREASSKFRAYAGQCILLIDVSQTGLDMEFHAMRPGGNPGLMAIWTANLPQEVGNVHEIYLEPGVRVWTAPEPGADPHVHLHRIRAGTRHVDEQRGCYVQLRPLPVRFR